MPRPHRLFVPGLPYHLYGRGVRNQDIFVCPEDGDHFLSLIEKLLPQHEIVFLSYCLMPNHYHFQVSDLNGDLSSFMQRLLTAYVAYFNRRYRKTGHLSERRFNSKPCRSEAQSLVLARYIDLNPVRARFVRHPRDWRWSGWREIFEGSHRKNIDSSMFRGLVGEFEEYRLFVEKKIAKIAEAVSGEIKSPVMMGGTGVFKGVSREILDRLIHSNFGPRGYSRRELRRKRFSSLTSIRAEFAQEATQKGVSQASIALFLGCSTSSVQNLLKWRRV